MSFNFKVPIEITIGTIPFKESFPTFQPQASAPPFTDRRSANNIANAIGFLPPYMLNEYPNLRKLIYVVSYVIDLKLIFIRTVLNSFIYIRIWDVWRQLEGRRRHRASQHWF